MGLFNGNNNYKKEYEGAMEDIKMLQNKFVDERARYDRNENQKYHEHQIEINNLVADHNIALQEEAYKLKHHKDEEIKVANDKVVEMEKKVAVLEAENKMLDEISDWNKDIIDIKELVTNLINKLPEVKINSLSVMGQNSTK